MSDVRGCERRAEIAEVLVGCCEGAEAVAWDWVVGIGVGSAGGVRGPAGEAMLKPQSTRRAAGSEGCQYAIRAC